MVRDSLGLLGLVFDTGLSVRLLMGHLGCWASHWSVTVRGTYDREPSSQLITLKSQIFPVKNSNI